MFYDQDDHKSGTFTLHHYFSPGKQKPFWTSKDLNDQPKNITITRNKKNLQKIVFKMTEELEYIEL